MIRSDDDDVPSPIDFHDPAQAREWEANTIKIRPFRPRFFDAFVGALNETFARPIAVLELGSGPGHLAKEILARCNIRRYVALDFSPAMHVIAREHLGVFKDRAEYVTRDFRSPNWGDALGEFDAAVTHQAAHETRHRRHLLPLLKAVRAKLLKNGLMLYSDHYAESEMEKNPALYVSRDLQPLVLEEAGFSEIRRLHDEGGIALYRALNAPQAGRT